jgi:hypothetical protein
MVLLNDGKDGVNAEKVAWSIKALWQPSTVD